MPKATQTPGAMLKALLAKNSLSVSVLAKEVHISDALIYYITQEKNRISVPVAFRIAKFFNTTPEYWLSAQMKTDIANAGKDKELQKALKSIAVLKKGKAGVQGSAD